MQALQIDVRCGRFAAAAATGAAFPLLLGYISSEVSLANGIAIFAAVAYSLFFICAFALPETHGKVLTVDG